MVCAQNVGGSRVQNSCLRESNEYEDEEETNVQQLPKQTKNLKRNTTTANKTKGTKGEEDESIDACVPSA